MSEPLYVIVSNTDSIEKIKNAITKENVNQQDEWGNTALYWAVYIEQDISIINLLLDNCADPNIGNMTPLHISCARNDPVISKRLVDAGADIHKVNHMGDSPLSLISDKDLFVYMWNLHKSRTPFKS
jgi:ankyrin repeat protein